MPEAGPDAAPLLAAAALILLVAVVALAVIAWITIGGPRRRLRKRMQALGLVEGKAGRKGRGDVDLSAHRQRRIQEKLQDLERQGRQRNSRRNRIRAELLQAGLTIDYRKYLMGVGLSGLAMALLLMLFGLAPWVALAGGVVASFGLPRFFLNILSAIRRKKFTSQFADAIDILVRGVRSGLPVGECLTIIGREMPDPVGQEFRLVVEGTKLGMPLDDLLQKGCERFPTAEYRFFAIVLQIQQQTGGNLAETLAGLSSVLRERKKMRDKVKAVSSEAKSSAMIIGSLPFMVSLLVYLMNPDYLGLLFTDRLGNFMLAGGLIWMGIGVVVMAKMVNFKI